MLGATPEYSTETLDIVKESIVVDLLGLLTLDYKKLINWQAKPESFQQQELRRLKESGVTILHPAVGFVRGDVYAESTSDLSRWNRFLAAQSEHFVRVKTVDDIVSAKSQNKIGIILGLQNSQHFRTEKDVDLFYGMGQRISQLTYFNNRLGGGSTDPNCGLSAYGGAIVKRMNDIGMAIDLSHCADKTTLDAMEASAKPVLFTHSNCRALTNHGRCKTDEAIRKLAANGGVFGVTLVRPFVRSGGAVTIEHVLDHVDHIASVGGIDHVALGTDVDFDGREMGRARTSDLDGISYPHKIHALVQGFLRRRYSRKDIQLILGGNSRRALKEIWAA